MAENDFYIKFGSNAKTFSDELKRDLGPVRATIASLQKELDDLHAGGGSGTGSAPPSSSPSVSHTNASADQGNRAAAAAPPPPEEPRPPDRAAAAAQRKTEQENARVNRAHIASPGGATNGGSGSSGSSREPEKSGLDSAVMKDVMAGMAHVTTTMEAASTKVLQTIATMDIVAKKMNAEEVTRSRSRGAEQGFTKQRVYKDDHVPGSSPTTSISTSKRYLGQPRDRPGTIAPQAPPPR